MTCALPSGLAGLSPDRPVLIAGPTASGKSALAVAIAATQGRAVVNADALQVFAGWPVLTAQPGPQDRARAEHLLYGHVPADGAYSVGDWLRDVAPLLSLRPAPVIVGGTGLYLSALTEGLAEIPSTDPAVRAAATQRRETAGLSTLVAELDAPTRARLDTRNPMRVQRAWEVLRQTGRGLADWQDGTGAPLVPANAAHLLQLAAPPDWLNPRIAARLRAMLSGPAQAEARARQSAWDPAHQSSRAIGAPELIALVRGEIDTAQAALRIETSTRQYAKRQRTWFRRRMRHWKDLPRAELCMDSGQHTK